MAIIIATTLQKASAQFYKPTTVNTPVVTLGYDQMNPEATKDGSGGYIVVWTDKRNNNDYNLYAQRYNSLGKSLWTSGGIPVCRLSSNETKPVICSDGSGGAIVAWMDDRSGTAVYAQRLNGSGIRQWDTFGVALTTTVAMKNSMSIVSDKNGGAYVIWSESRSDVDIIGQRVDAGGTILWGTDGVDICNASTDQTNPSMTNYKDSGIVVAWEDLRAGKKALSDIYAQRMALDGKNKWTANGILITAAQDEQLLPKLCEDDSSGVYICWQDNRLGTPDIYAHRVNGFGTIKWGVNGQAVCSATGAQLEPAIARDGNGGCVIAWKDGRTPGTSYIYAQQLDATGSNAWTANGINVCGANGSREAPRLLENSSEKGVFVSWSDDRNGNMDVFVQKLNNSGTGLWVKNGIAVSTASAIQSSARMVDDGFGGIFLVWNDTRNSSNGIDVYTQNVMNEGGLGIDEEISVKGNGIIINDNDNSPSASDYSDMGSVRGLNNIIKTFYIHNSGNDTLKVSSIYMSGTAASSFTPQSMTYPLIINPRASQAFTLTFVSTNMGVFNAVLNIDNSDSTESTYNFAVKATVLAAKLEIKGNNTLIQDGSTTISVSDSTDFGKVRPGKMVSRTYVLSSAGTDTLSISNITITGTSAADFSFKQISYPRKLNSGGNLYLIISFAPGTTGTKSAELNVFSNDFAIQNYNFKIEGQCVLPAIKLKGNNKIIVDGDITPSLNDNSDFGKVRVNNAINKSFVIQNEGTDTLKISNIDFTGLNRQDFNAVNSISFPNNLLPGDSLIYEVEFKSISLGVKNATLNVYSDDVNSNVFNFDVTANSIAPELIVKGKNIVITNGDNTPETANGTAFGNLRKNMSRSNKINISNTGTDALTISTIALYGANSTQFSISGLNDNTVVPSGQSVDLTIVYQPTAKGDHSANIKISSDDVDEPEFEFAVSGKMIVNEIVIAGNNREISNGKTSTDSLENTHFGTIENINTVERTFRITNMGDDTLMVNELKTSGANMNNFEIESLSVPFKLLPGEYKEFKVTFKPVDKGDYKAVMSVLNNDDDESVYTFALSGTAYEKQVGLEITGTENISLFPNPANQSFSVVLPENIGDAELTICSMQGQDLVKVPVITGAIFSVNVEQLAD
ncbi:MAG TPA: choice-of-anchor D domain-containing protein, partial [Bacteroidia bacterium]